MNFWPGRLRRKISSRAVKVLICFSLAIIVLLVTGDSQLKQSFESSTLTRQSNLVTQRRLNTVLTLSNRTQQNLQSEKLNLGKRTSNKIIRDSQIITRPRYVKLDTTSKAKSEIESPVVINEDSNISMISIRAKPTSNTETLDHLSKIDQKDAKPTPIKKGNRLAEKSKAGSLCPDAALISKFKANKNSTLSCKPHKSPEKACVFASELYKHQVDLESCKINKQQVDICKITQIDIDVKYKIKFSCNPDVCQLKSGGRVTASIICPQKGKLKLKGAYNNINKLESDLTLFATNTHAAGHNFIFIDCLFSNGKFDKDKTQLIMLPPQIPKRLLFEHATKSKIGYEASPLNINIILVDSVSRAHFYRSLPKTLQLFNSLNSQKYGAEVLDFELFQAVDGHTAENFHAFFSGKLMPKDIKPDKKRGYPVGHKNIFKIFKDAGYYTLYMDDLCWEQVWGLRLDLGNSGTFSQLMDKAKKNFIDEIGITTASCKILKHNGVTHPFNGPPNNQICYNGKFHHQYLFEYLIKFYDENHLVEQKTPRLSFTVIDTAHDYTGLRIQTLDQSLASFLEVLSKSSNTLTILMADHGNTYTKYTHAVLEGRFEMFHPSFFMLIPENVARVFGDERINTLRLNQNRLFTMVDVHNTLRALGLEAQGQTSREKGILNLISPTRTCDNIDMNLPNLCVCEGWDTATENDTSHIGLLDFAAGSLNNMINKQKYKAHTAGKSNPFPSNRCVRLVPISFYNVRERNTGDHLITTMEFSVVAGKGSGQAIDIFHVEIQSFTHPKSNSLKLKLLNFDRISQYGKYRSCVDEGVDVKLCVCDITNGEVSTYLDKRILLGDTFNRQTALMNARIKIEHKPSLPCLYFIRREYDGEKNAIHAAGVEVLNICSSQRFEVILTLTVNNLKYSQTPPFKADIRPFGVTYLGTTIKNVPYWSSSIKTKFFVNKRPF